MTLNFYLPSAQCGASMPELPHPVLCSPGGVPSSNYFILSPAIPSRCVFSAFLVFQKNRRLVSSPLWAPYLSFSEEPHSPQLNFWGIFWGYHIVMIGISLGKLLCGGQASCVHSQCTCVWKLRSFTSNIGLLFIWVGVSHWPEAYCLANCLANKPNRFACLCFPSPKITNTCTKLPGICAWTL